MPTTEYLFQNEVKNTN